MLVFDLSNLFSLIKLFLFVYFGIVFILIGEFFLKYDIEMLRVVDNFFKVLSVGFFCLFFLNFDIWEVFILDFKVNWLMFKFLEIFNFFSFFLNFMIKFFF